MVSKACPKRELHTRLLFNQPNSATTKSINVPVYWDMTPCILVHTYRNFGQSCHLNPQVEVNHAVKTLFFPPRNTGTYIYHTPWRHIFIRCKFTVAALRTPYLIKCMTACSSVRILTLILRRSRTATVWFYTSTSNKRAARPKLYTKSLTRDLKRMYIRFTLVRISIKL